MTGTKGKGKGKGKAKTGSKATFTIKPKKGCRK